MTPDREVIVLALYAGLCIGFIAGVIVTGCIVELHRWRARRWLRKWEREGKGIRQVIFQHPRQVGKTTAELHAYRAEVALMARSDAHPLARSIAAKLTARVAMRMAGGTRHG